MSYVLRTVYLHLWPSYGVRGRPSKIKKGQKFNLCMSSDCTTHLPFTGGAELARCKDLESGCKIASSRTAQYPKAGNSSSWSSCSFPFSQAEGQWKRGDGCQTERPFAPVLRHAARTCVLPSSSSTSSSANTAPKRARQECSHVALVLLIPACACAR